MPTFTCIFVSGGHYRFEEILARDLASALDWLLSAELKSGERPFGVWYDNRVYELLEGTLHQADSETTGKIWAMLN
jgi:hypothetical protein